MDIHFSDLSEVPLPPDEVRVQDLQVEPYPDGKRLRITLELTPFQKSPSGEVSLTDLMGNQLAITSIIEAIEPKMQFTMHLRAPEPKGPFTARAVIFYSESIDEITEGDKVVSLPGKKIVDEKEVQFEMGE